MLKLFSACFVSVYLHVTVNIQLNLLQVVLNKKLPGYLFSFALLTWNGCE